MTKLSPFQKEFWKNKGYSDEDALFHSRACKPIFKEYWLKIGYSEYEASELAKQKKHENNKKGARKNANKSYNELRKESVRCPEYWLEKGYNYDEAQRMVSNYQKTFSYERCIEKYGKKKGYQIWKERQEKWSKAFYDNNNMDEVNKKKAPTYENLKRTGKTDEEIKEFWLKKGCKHIFEYKKELIDHIHNELTQKPHKRYIPYKKLKRELVPRYSQDFLGISDSELKKIIKPYLLNGVFKIYSENTSGKYNAFRMWAGNSLLRSLFEIYFYELLKKYEIDCKIDGKYPKSNMRYDFYLPNIGIYIEIAPMYNTKGNEKYTEKMNKKKELFGAYILDADTSQYESWLLNHLRNHY